MKPHIEIVGCLLILLGLLHVTFPSHFKWRETLASVPRVSREIMYVHTFFIALTVFLMGLLCITSAEEIVDTPLGKKLAIGLAVFWTIRLLIQFFGYSKELWQGKRFETIMHICFSFLWLYLSAVFWTIALIVT